MPTLLHLCFVLAAALGAARCASGPAEPLPPYLSAYPAGKYGYGYTEERLGPDTWRVIYHGPWQELPLEATQRGAALERAAVATNELALLRAAQLARAENKPAFSIADRRTDTDTQRQPAGFAYDPFWPNYSPLYERHGRYPYWHAPLWSTPAFVPGHAAGRSKTTLVIRLEPRMTPNTIDAAATEERLQQTWRGRAPAR